MIIRNLKRKAASIAAWGIWLSLIGFGIKHWGDHTSMLLLVGAASAMVSLQLDFYSRREDWIAMFNPEEFGDLWLHKPDDPLEYVNDYSKMQASVRWDYQDAAFKGQKDAWAWLLDEQHKESPVSGFIKNKINKSSMQTEEPDALKRKIRDYTGPEYFERMRKLDQEDD